MREILLGFRVVAKRGKGEAKVDNFELRQSAVECAQRLDGLGWAKVECFKVHGYDFEGWTPPDVPAAELEELVPIDFRAEVLS